MTESNVSSPGTEIQVQTVQFHGEDILAVIHDGEPYIVPKRICENLGIDWEAQRKKLSSDSLWSVAIIEVPSSGGVQLTCLIPLRRLAGWLFTLRPKMVAPAVREKVRLYCQECCDVLYRHFSRPAIIEAPSGESHQPAIIEAPSGESRQESIGFTPGFLERILEAAQSNLTMLSNGHVNLEKQVDETKDAVFEVREATIDLHGRVQDLEADVSWIKDGKVAKVAKPVQEEFLTVYAYCQRNGIKTDKETNRQHSNRLKTIIERDDLPIAPKVMRVGNSSWPLYHWPLSFLDRYFSHQKNRDLCVGKKRSIWFGGTVDKTGSGS